jgi:nucleotide-binding universal stress UspA family protein
MHSFRTILLATDFSRQAGHALRLAQALARDSGGDLFVIHVIPDCLRRTRSYRQAARRTLSRLAASDPTVRAQTLLVVGDPPSQIVGTAGQLDCDVIVLGTAGRTGLRRLLAGSVAESVRKLALCPVLTVALPVHEMKGPRGRDSTHNADQLAHQEIKTAREAPILWKEIELA